MSNIPIRFGQGQGLEAAASTQTQVGLTELRNVALDLRDVIQKRDGSEQIALTTGAGAEDVLDPAGLQAVAYRGDELVVWSDRQLWSRSQCSSADTSDVPVGVATDAQISAARSAAITALRPRQSFVLPGYVDGGTVVATPDARPLSATASGSGVVAVVARIGSGAITASLSGTAGGFAVSTTPITLLAGGGLGGTDVRCVFVGVHTFPGGGGSGPWFAASWRSGSGDSLTWSILRPDISGSGVTYASEFAQTIATGNRPYDLVYQDTVTDGQLATLIYSGSAGTLSGRSREDTGSWGTLLQRDVTLSPGIALVAGDVVRALPDALTLGGQSAALFLRRAGRNEYRPIRFDAGFTPASIRIPPSPTGTAPMVALSSSFALQVVGVRDDVSGGLHVFTGSPVDLPEWVATRASSSTATLTAGHTVECEQTASTWLLRRDGQTCLSVTQDGGNQRALLQVAGVVVGLIASVPVLRRWSWQPVAEGPTPAYAVVANTEGHLAAAQSANRVAYVYQGVATNQIAVVSSDDGLAFGTSGLTTLPSGESVAQAAGALVIDTETGSGGVTASWYYVGNFSGTAKIARRDVSTAVAVQGTPLATACQASVTTVHASDYTTFRLVVINVQPTASQSAVTYEFGADHVVQVDPRLVSLTAGNFGARGPWTAARLRQELPIQDIGGGVIAGCDVGQIQDCRILLWQVSGGTVPGIYVAIYSDHLELPSGYTRVDATGTRPRVVVNHGDGSALLTYLSAGGTIQAARWTPSSSSIAFASTGISPSNTVYLTLAASTEIGVPAHKYIIIAGGIGTNHRVVRLDAGTLAILFNELFNLGTMSALFNAGAIELTGSDFIRVRYAFPSVAGIATSRISLIDGTPGTLLASNANSYTVVPANVAGVAVASPDGTSNYHLLIERSDESGVTLASNATTEPATLRRRYYRSTIWSTAARVDDGKTYVVLAGGRAVFNALASYFLLDLDTLEIVSRAFAEEGESTASRSDRLTTGHLSVPSRELVADPSRVLYAAGIQRRGSDTSTPVLSQSSLGDLVCVGIASVDFDDAPFTPAEMDGVLVHAHAGYARCYAGDLPHEQDFHGFPLITAIATPAAAGSLSSGGYSAIALYEATDAAGNVQRSALAWLGVAQATAGDSFTVTTQNLSLTERRNVSLVTWRTQANGSVYYRDQTVANDPDAAAQVVITSTLSDVALALREQLDLSLVVRNPGPATDLIAAVGGRFMTRDPERGSLARFTTARTEGFAPWWNFAQGIEVPSQRDITAIGDLDGRVVLFTGTDIAVAQGDGPSVTGAGGYQEPDRLPSEIGALGQIGLAEIPQGLVFGSAAGPRILTRTLETQDIAEQVYRYFEFDGYVPGRSLYLPDQATLIIAARRSATDELVLRLHVANGRWAEDTERPILDMATSRAGVVAYLGRDGRLLIEGDGSLIRYQNLLALRSVLGAYPEYMFNGTLTDLVAGATLSLEGGAFIANELDTLGVFNRTSYEATGIDGESVVAEDTTIGDLGTDNSLAIVWSQTLDSAPVGNAVMGKLTSGNEGWIVTASGAALALTIGPAGGGLSTVAALTAASLTVGVRHWFCAVIDFATGLIRIGSDSEAEIGVAIADPSASYATTDPLRFLDALSSPTPAIDGRVHWAALYRGTNLATLFPDCNAIAQALKGADEAAVGVTALAALPDRTDGDQSYVTSVRTPWLREPKQDGQVHTGFTFVGASLFGEYLGSHALTVQVYYDFATVPETEITIPHLLIDDEALAGRPYIYRIEGQDRRCYAVLVRFADGAEPNPTYRGEGIDIAYKSDGGKLVELPGANIAGGTA